MMLLDTSNILWINTIRPELWEKLTINTVNYKNGQKDYPGYPL